MYNLEILTTAELMSAHYELVNQLDYNYSRAEYQSLYEEMIPKGYSQLAVFEDKRCIAIAGFWISAKLYSGKYVELDNVVVDKDKRSAGIGRLICDKIEEIAVERGCRLSVLNAYVQNSEAHKFYFRHGYKILGFHFHKKL